MTYTFKLARRIARLRPSALALTAALLACDGTDSFNPDSSEPLHQTDSPALAFAGGIPIGTFAQPNEEFGSTYNGAMRNIWPQHLLANLAEIKARGGKVVLMFAGPEHNYKTGSGTFDLNEWKARVQPFTSVDFSSYIKDGTVVGHYLIDEPQDRANWNGTQISQATIEEMARFSKERWPTMPTIARTWPDYLDDYSGQYRYLDAAWAQYAANRFPDADEFLATNVAKAKAKGLALVVGLNLRDGGPTKGNMTASQVKAYGSALLASTYPCAFLSWKFDEDYLGRGEMREAMSHLRGLAQNRPFKGCQGAALGSKPPSDPDPEPDPDPDPDPSPEPPPSGSMTLPFGLSHAPIEAYSAPWTGTMYVADPAQIVERLDRAERSGMKVIVSLVRAAQARNPDGSFSLTRWKAEVERYRRLPLAGYVSSRALYMHHLVDQPRCASCWGGKAIPWSTIEEMARHSKSLWPALPTMVRVPPSALAAATFRWTHLDAGWALYNTRQGDLRRKLASEVSHARAEGLGLVAGLNLMDAAGQNTAPMTAGQIREFGGIMAADPAVCAVVNWRYDGTYLRKRDVLDALAAVAAVARGRNAGSCVGG